jgi:hypothetical protein
VARGTSHSLDENETIEFSGFVDALTAVEQTHDFIVVDTAGSDTHLARIAHSMADTLITPLNDSFVTPRCSEGRSRDLQRHRREPLWWMVREARRSDAADGVRWTVRCAIGCRCWITQQATRDQGPGELLGSVSAAPMRWPSA